MTPEQINTQHGKPTWKCWGCKAETGLQWFFGLSVAVCNKPECSKAYSDMCQRQIEEALGVEQ